ncbi:hypothetical protein KFU94_01245 [Chloroflexi bacterium TSY]|nr:hypothetical protein [Chloroflexi bacterium TSY]
MFAYDGLGRRISQTRTIDGTSFTMMTLSFDAKHRPLQIRYPNQDEVIISYDREGAVVDSTTVGEWWNLPACDACGSQCHGSGEANGAGQ